MEPEIRHKPIRYYEIDLLRFIAALAVVIYHFTFAGYHHGVSPVQYPELAQVFKYGFLGVELFFMISGYVVLLSAQGKTIGQFFTSRVTRLYPAYWVACTLCFVVVRLFAPAESGLDASIGHYVVNMTMLQAFFNIPNLDGVYWSLTYEIVFYFLIAIMISFQWLKHPIGILTAWLGYCLVATLAFNTGPFSFLFFPQYAPYFIAGMIMFLIQTGQGARWKMCLLLLASYGLAITACLEQIAGTATHYHQPFSKKVAVALITLFFIAFLLIINRKLKIKQSKWLTYAGALTYPMYLCHHNIGYVTFQRLGSKVDKHILLGAMLATVLLLAYLINTFIERRFSTALGQRVSSLLSRA
jgi:peptidoglycan/LPS O-acetylase OafA/YrhL